jgi:uncharacterized membrane protein
MIHSTNTVTETQLRSLIKTVVYRLASSVMIYFLALFLGASGKGAAGAGLSVLLFGAFTYYCQERIWLFFGWGRDQGDDSVKRTLYKTIAYRIFIFFLAFITALVFITNDYWIAFVYSVTQIPASFVLFFVLERLFNWMSWGKKAVTLS